MSATVVEITNWARPQIGRKIHRVRSRTRIDTQLRKQGLIVGRGRKMRRVKPFVVTTDGKNYLLQSEWKRTLKDGELLAVIACPPAGGGNGSRIIAILAIIALSIVTAGAAAVLATGAATAAAATATTLGAVVYGVTAAAVTIAGNMLLNAVMPPPKPPSGQNRSTSSPNYSIQAQGNSARLMEALPVLYGRFRIYPDYAAQPYTDYRSNDQYLYQLFVITQGQMQIESIRIGETDVDDFTDVQYEVIQPGGTITMFPDNVVSSDAVAGIQLEKPSDGGTWAGPFVTNPPETTTNRIGIDVAWPGGLYRYNDKGKKRTANSPWQAQAQLIDDEGNVKGDWFDLIVQDKWSDQEKPIFESYNFNVANGRYQVRLRQNQPQSQDGQIVNTMSWQGLKAYLPSHATYGDCTMLAMIIKAGSQVNGTTSRKISVIGTRMLPVFDGTTWSAPQPTRNPAWALADAFRNTTYGRGWSDKRLNLEGLLSLAQTWDQRGDTYDGVFDTKVSLWDAVSQIARVGRAMPMNFGGVIDIIRDSPRGVPTLLLTPDNIVEGSLKIDYSYISYDSPDYVVVEYTNPNTWQPQTVDCALTGSAKLSPKNIQLTGAIDRAQAFREGMYMAACNRDQRKFITVTVEMEGYIPRYGDRVDISHDMPAWGLSGRIVDFDRDTGTLTTSEPLAWYEGQTHYVGLRSRDGGTQGLYQVTQGADLYHMTLAGLTSDQLAEIYISDGSSEEPTFYQFGPGTQQCLSCLLLRATSQGDDKIELYMVNYAPSVYEAENNASVPPPPSPSLLTPASGAPSVGDVGIVQNNGSNIVHLYVDPVPGAVAYEFEVSYDGGLTWVPVGVSPINSIDAALPPGDWLVRARAISVTGTPGGWTQTQGTVNDPHFTIGGLAQFVATGVQLGITLSWSFPAGLESFDTQYVEILMGTEDDIAQAQPLANVAYPTSIYNVTGLLPGDTRYFWARMVGRADGNVSAWTRAVGVTASVDSLFQPVQDQIDQLNTDVGNVQHGVDDAAAAIQQEVTDRTNADTAEAAARAAAIQQEVSDRTAAVQGEADARVQGLQQEASDRADAIAAEAAARGAAITAEQTARQDADSSLSDRIDTNTAAIGQNTSAIQDEETARASADSAEANSRQLLATQMRGDYAGNDLSQVSTGLIASERNARSTQFESLAQQMTLLSAGVGEQFDYDAIWYFDTDAEGWTGNGVPTWNQSWLRPANSTEPYLVSPLETTGIVSGAEYNQLRMRIRKTGAPTWAGKLWWKPTVAVTFGAPDGSTKQFQLVDAAGVAVTSNVNVNAIYRTDWQGRQLLYPAPRTNQDPHSNDGSAWASTVGVNWTTAATDKTFAGRVPYTEVIRQTVVQSTPILRINYPPILTAPMRVIWSLAVRAGTSNKIDLGLYQAAANPTTSWGDPGTYGGRIISGPGTITFSNGVKIGSLSPDEDTLIELWRDYVAGDRVGALMYIGSRSGAVIGDSNLVTRSMITFGQSDQGALIETNGAPVTVTDYTVNEAGMVSLGEVPAEDAALEWEGTGTNANGDSIATIAADFSDDDSIDITEPDYDSDGIGMLVVNTGWTDTVGQIKLQLTAAQTATDYDEIDWIAIGRPAPGASSAALASEEMARAAADVAEATSRQTLSVKLVGEPDPTGVTLDNITSGLIADEKSARVTADESQVSRIETMEARMPSGTGGLATSASVADEATARATADDALSTRTGAIEARMPSGNGGLATSASVTAEQQARADADTALGQQISAVSAVADGAATSAQLTAEQTARADADTALGQQINIVQAQSGFVFRDVFDGGNALIRWKRMAGTNPVQAVIDSTDSIMGGEVWQIGDDTTDSHSFMVPTDRIPFDPNKLYRVRCRFRRVSGDLPTYLGVIAFTADKTTPINTSGANSVSPAHYVSCAPAIGTFVEYVGYMKGHAAHGVAPIGNTFDAPAPLIDGAMYFAPVIYTLYSSGIGQVEIDYFIIEDADASGQAQTAQAQIATEETTRADADSALSDRIDTVEATANDAATQASLTAEQQARADADGAMASDIALIGAHNADKSAFILNQNTVQVDGDTSFAQMLSGIQATASANAQAAQDAQTAADGAAQDAATAAGIANGKADVLIQSSEPAASYQKGTTLWIDTTGGANTPKRWDGTAWTVVTDKTATDAAAAAATAQAAATAAQQAADSVNARVDTEAQTRADGDTALGQRIDSVQATVDQNSADIQTEQQARADGDSANALAIQSVQAQVDAFTAYYSQTFNGSAGDWTISGATYEQFPYGGANNYGALVIHTGASQTDPNLLSPALKIGGTQGNVVRAMIRIRDAGYTWQGQLYWGNTNHSGFSESYTAFAPDPGAGKWVMVEWDVSGISDWTGATTTSIRLDLQNSANTHVDVAWVAIGLKSDAVSKAQATQTFQAQVNADGTAYAQAAVLVDASGHIGGTRLASDGTTSSFDIVADRFSVIRPDGRKAMQYQNGMLTISSADSGQRTVTTEQNIKVYDSNGTLRVAIGVNI